MFVTIFAIFACFFFICAITFKKQLGFRPVQHLKMTIWTSVLRKIFMQLAKKWLEMVVKRIFRPVANFGQQALIIYSTFRKTITMFGLDGQAWMNCGPPGTRSTSIQWSFVIYVCRCIFKKFFLVKLKNTHGAVVWQILIHGKFNKIEVFWAGHKNLKRSST